MTKKIAIVSVVVVALAVGYWLLSPFWRTNTLDESLPGVIKDVPASDGLIGMDAGTKAEFNRQMQTMKDKVMQTNEVMPVNQPEILAKVKLVARAHEVQGSALLVKAAGETFLRFEDLRTVNGPDLRIYLSADLSDKDVVDLGPIRATDGNVNYVVPAGTDLSKYRNAMIWCRAFGILFSYGQF